MRIIYYSALFRWNGLTRVISAADDPLYSLKYMDYFYKDEGVQLVHISGRFFKFQPFRLVHARCNFVFLFTELFFSATWMRVYFSSI